MSINVSALLVGGGGGGGGAQGQGDIWGGGGGGSGGYTSTTFTVNLGDVINIVAGQGGGHGAASFNGNFTCHDSSNGSSYNGFNGGDSIISLNGSTVATAGGGMGGGGSNPGIWGPGGAGGSPDGVAGGNGSGSRNNFPAAAGGNNSSGTGYGVGGNGNSVQNNQTQFFCGTNGGNGAVIVTIPASTTITISGSPTVTTDVNNNTIYTFTSDGSLTVSVPLTPIGSFDTLTSTTGNGWAVYQYGQNYYNVDSVHIFIFDSYNNLVVTPFASTLGGSRTDVCPNIARTSCGDTCPCNCGWNFTYNSGSFSPGVYTVQARAYTADFADVVIGTQYLTIPGATPTPTPVVTDTPVPPPPTATPVVNYPTVQLSINGVYVNNGGTIALKAGDTAIAAVYGHSNTGILQSVSLDTTTNISDPNSWTTNFSHVFSPNVIDGNYSADIGTYNVAYTLYVRALAANNGGDTSGYLQATIIWLPPGKLAVYTPWVVSLTNTPVWLESVYPFSKGVTQYNVSWGNNSTSYNVVSSAENFLLHTYNTPALGTTFYSVTAFSTGGIGSTPRSLYRGNGLSGLYIKDTLPTYDINNYFDPSSQTPTLPYSLSNVLIGSNEWAVSDVINESFNKLNKNFDYIRNISKVLNLNNNLALIEWCAQFISNSVPVSPTPTPTSTGPTPTPTSTLPPTQTPISYSITINTDSTAGSQAYLTYNGNNYTSTSLPNGTYDIHAVIPAGYTFSGWFVTGGVGYIATFNSKDTTLTTSNAGVVVEAFFAPSVTPTPAPVRYNVSSSFYNSTPAGASISPAGTFAPGGQDYNSGSNITLYPINLPAGYAVASWYINGIHDVSADNNPTYTIINLTQITTVEIHLSYSVTPTSTPTPTSTHTPTPTPTGSTPTPTPTNGPSGVNCNEYVLHGEPDVTVTYSYIDCGGYTNSGAIAPHGTYGPICVYPNTDINMSAGYYTFNGNDNCGTPAITPTPTPVVPTPTPTPTCPPYGYLISTYCQGFSLIGVYSDGNCTTYDNLIAVNSTDCGYVPSPTPTPGGLTVTLSDTTISGVVTNNYCANALTSIINVTDVTGGSGDYSYSWDINNGNINIIDANSSSTRFSAYVCCPACGNQNQLGVATVTVTDNQSALVGRASVQIIISNLKNSGCVCA